ncbi:MAG: hypothetical protein IPM37_10520 [Hahellaceae bacterium]|nr:hypothetical protein [Hahellaceae bacterium]
MPVLNIRAILAGLLVDLVGSFAAWLVVLTAYASMLLGQGVSEAELETILSDPSQLGDIILVLMCAGILFDGFAGYVTARMSPRVEYWNVLALVGLLCLMHFSANRGEGVELAYQTPALIGGIVAAFIGGGLAKRRRRPLE